LTLKIHLSVPFVIDTMKSVQDGVEDLSIDCMKKASLFLRATAPSVRGNRATNAKIATAKAAPMIRVPCCSSEYDFSILYIPAFTRQVPRISRKRTACPSQ
jgi:hypothetical protein